MTPLRQRMLEDMQIRNLSPHTQRAYVENVARFARHLGRSPADLGPEEIRTYQVYLIRERHLAPSSHEIAVCALRFLYKVTLKQPWSADDVIPAPKKPRPLPVILSPDEVVQLLSCVHAPKHHAILTTCYAAGLRVSETIQLRPTDIDSRRMVIRIARHDERERLADVFALKGAPAGQHLEEYAPEGPDVAALVGLASLRLLGTQVRRGPEQHANARLHPSTLLGVP